MSTAIVELANLVLRQSTEEPAVDPDAPPACGGGNSYDGRMGLRVSAVFVILIGSTLGALFPIIATRNPSLRVPGWAFLFTKYFGSGVIIATAFIHLLTPANEALTNECLTGPITSYPWAQGISMISVFVIFFVELLAMRLATPSTIHLHSLENPTGGALSNSEADTIELADPESLASIKDTPRFNGDYAAQLTSIFILEFGVIFHSIFIGLTLAVSGEEFTTLYIVLVFHQAFEGLGLGSRLASVPFPDRWTPYIMAICYGLSTPLAIAVGLGVRTSFDPESQTALILNGVFDAISSGILLYTGLVELMAHEFLFGKGLREQKLSHVLVAFAYMVLGAALMATLGKWA